MHPIIYEAIHELSLEETTQLLADLTAEFAETELFIKRVKSRVKTLILEAKQSEEMNGVKMTYRPPHKRIVWDSTKLQQLATANESVRACMKSGTVKAGVTIKVTPNV